MARSPRTSSPQITSTADLPEVFFSDEGNIRHLHLESIWIQGSMDQDEPYRLVHEYVQRMQSWLLFVEPDTVAQRQAVQLGLGAASLTKHCSKVLHMRQTTAIELNPRVLHACRGWFQLPANNTRMQVLIADAAEEIRQPHWHGVVDALHVDLYDQEAAAPVLDSSDFYTDCRAMLTDEGCMTVNLFGRSSSFDRSVEHIASAFGADAVWAFKATREGNTVVLAQRTPSRPKRQLLMQRAETITARWGLPAVKWVRGFKPVQP
ncbi:spermidine synthase [Curvibacter sp. CHRR-16]|uniref:spermidine synthase n=1 Tax=Curvibacter sp. CHRR-16 TaxID=2835872 RepID=UPI001BD9F88E|nr:spermidine synthase [Curvibacter sp. CHRR-16]MBT0571670.1 spermidine synthase [Curvibacter sp. CHRR-16]